MAVPAHDYLEKSKLADHRFRRVITLFGQPPLFFYVVRLQVCKVVSLMPLLKRSLAQGCVAWLVGLAVMIPSVSATAL